MKTNNTEWRLKYGTNHVNTDRAICHAIEERLLIVVVINKMDRLITKIKFPPIDAYHKLKHTLQEINNLITAFSTGDGGSQLVDPAFGNVCFSSASTG